MKTHFMSRIALVVLTVAAFGVGVPGPQPTRAAAPLETCVPPPDGLVSWWPGDGNAKDIRGDNHGTLTNEAAFDIGMVDQAFRLDGVDDFVIVEDDASLDVANITMMAWVNPAAGSVGFRNIVVKATSTGWAPPYAVYALRLTPTDRLNFFTNDYDSRFLDSNASIPSEQWTFVAATYDGNMEKVYVNGIFDNSRAASGAINNSSQPLVMGVRNSVAQGEFFEGRIDEVGIFNCALSDAEIQTIYDAGSEGVCKPPTFEIFLPLALRPCTPLFVDYFGDPASGWPDLDTGNTLYQYLSGEYHILLRNPGWFAGATPDYYATDYILAVDVRNPTGVYGTYGLLFGLADDWTGFYTFEIDPEGNYEIWRYNYYGGGFTLLTSGFSGAINQGTASNRLKLERNGSLIEAYANDTLLTSISDGTFTGSRQLGLTVTSFDEGNLDVYFGAFTVYPTTCDAAEVRGQEGRVGEPAGAYFETQRPGAPGDR